MESKLNFNEQYDEALRFFNWAETDEQIDSAILTLNRLEEEYEELRERAGLIGQ